MSIQFILDGVSYDIFPMSWERLLANASMDSPQGYLLIDTEIIYCSDDSILKKFNDLKDSLTVVLSGQFGKLLVNKAYEYLNECYIYLYNMEEFKDDFSSIKLEVGKLVNKIASAVVFANSTYYKNSNGKILSDSMNLKKLPRSYKETIDSMIFSNDIDEILKKSRTIIRNTREFLKNERVAYSETESFESLFNGYFEELKKSINKCYNAISEQNYYTLYELIAYMQEELAQFIAACEEGVWYDDRNTFGEYSCFGESFVDGLLELVSKKDDVRLLKEIKQFEDDIRKFVAENGVEILEFGTVIELSGCISNM